MGELCAISLVGMGKLRYHRLAVPERVSVLVCPGI